jgi:hypothetical protein
MTLSHLSIHERAIPHSYNLNRFQFCMLGSGIYEGGFSKGDPANTVESNSLYQDDISIGGRQ